MAETLTRAEGSCFWRHDWSKWEQYTVEGKKYMADGQLHPSSFVKQRRTCFRCNKRGGGKVTDEHSMAKTLDNEARKHGMSVAVEYIVRDSEGDVVYASTSSEDVACYFGRLTIAARFK